MDYIIRTSIKPVILTGGRNVSVKDGTCQVSIQVIRYYSDLKPKTVRTPVDGVRVKPKDWDKKNSKVKRSDENYVWKNTLITNKQALIEHETEQLKKGKAINTAVLPLFQAKKLLVDHINDYISIRSSDGTKMRTVASYIAVKKRLERYQDHIGYKLDFPNINMTFSDNFYAWARQEGMADGTIEKTYKILRTMLTYFWERRDETKVIMNEKFKIKSWKKGTSSENEPNPLSPEQFILLKNYQFEGDLDKCKDRILWQCVTGMRYGDAFTITSKHIVGNFIEYYPSKTAKKRDNLVLVPINPTAGNILRKYNNDLTKLAVNNADYNYCIGKLFKILEEKYPDQFAGCSFTSHSFRDTFITICINNEVDVPSLLRMVGQSSWQIMKKYYKVDKNRMAEKMNKVLIFS